jgi:hypothetical protein
VTPGPLRIVLAGGFLACYPEGGGHWTGFLQYPTALRALGHDAVWLELLASAGDPDLDRARARGFFERMEAHGLAGRCALLLHDRDDPAPALDTAEVHGIDRRGLEALVTRADLVWNFACALPPSLLSLFRRRVLVDGDPGHLQVSALTEPLPIGAHDAFLTVGTNLHAPGCEVPTLGLRWHRFLPLVHLPWWPVVGDPGPDAPFTSVTQWTWEEIWLGDRVLSVSKRAAYLAHLDLPGRTGRPFELAVNLHPGDDTGDRERLRQHGWRRVHPPDVAGSPETYRRYVARSRAELGCPKPIHRALRTGWFSDRSAGYLASGRPVLFEDTGLADRLPAGKGLLLFRDPDEAAAGVAEIDARWELHHRAARAIAEEFLDARRVLPAMLEASL